MAMRLLDDRGAALVVALLVTTLMAAIGMALVLTTTVEVAISGRYGARQEAMYAAEAALERALGDLLAAADWNGILQGTQRSSFTDGAASGTRMLADGARLDLSAMLNVANCGRATTCTTSDMDAATADRPWGANNPRWTLYAHGPLSAMLPPESIAAPIYVVVLVGDDSLENDNNPIADGSDAENPGSGLVSLRAEAFGAGGTHAAIEVTVSRARLVSWRAIR